MEKDYKSIYGTDLCTIEMMKELEEMGFDTSDASCMWSPINDDEYNPKWWIPCFRGEDKISIEELRVKFPLTYKEGNVYYCYTLNDLIKKLPEYIEINGEKYFLWWSGSIFRYSAKDNNGNYIGAYLETFDRGGDNSMIGAAFEMLKELKNNYENI